MKTCDLCHAQSRWLWLSQSRDENGEPVGAVLHLCFDCRQVVTAMRQHVARTAPTDTTASATLDHLSGE